MPESIIYNFLITLHGFPTATEFDGISLTTTEPAPMTTLFPIVTPESTQTFPPNQTLSLIVGLIIGGMIKLIPYNKNIPEGISVTWNPLTIITSILALLLGALLIIIIQLIVNKKGVKK